MHPDSRAFTPKKVRSGGKTRLPKRQRKVARPAHPERGGTFTRSVSRVQAGKYWNQFYGPPVSAPLKFEGRTEFLEGLQWPAHFPAPGNLPAWSDPSKW